MEPNECTIEIPGVTLAAKRWGPIDGTPTLALHGWLDNAATFDRLAPLLPDLQWVCVDLAGHGRSGHRHRSATYDFIYWVPDVVAMADALGWERFNLVGHSLGAIIGATVAGTYPGRLRRLVLLDGLGPTTAEPELGPELLAEGIETQQRLASMVPNVMPDVAVAGRRLRQAIADLDQASAELLVERGTRRTSEGLVWSHDPRLRAKSMWRLSETQVHAFLGRITCPTLVVRPGSGWPMDPEVTRRRLACLRTATVHQVPGGHHVHLVHPQRVAGAVREFLGHDGR